MLGWILFSILYLLGAGGAFMMTWDFGYDMDLMEKIKSISSTIGWPFVAAVMLVTVIVEEIEDHRAREKDKKEEAEREEVRKAEA